MHPWDAPPQPNTPPTHPPTPTPTYTSPTQNNFTIAMGRGDASNHLVYFTDPFSLMQHTTKSVRIWSNPR